MNLRPALAASFAALALLAPSQSFAFERQWHFGGSFGYTALMSSHATLHGLGGGLHLTYGLTDALNLMAEVNVSGHYSRLDDPPVDDNGKPTGALAATLPSTLFASGAVGVGYVFDVLQWVPYVGGLVGAADLIDTSGACGATPETPCHSPLLNLQVPFGLDYSISRSFAVGVGGRYQMLIGGPNGLTHGLTGLLRAEYVWGY